MKVATENVSSYLGNPALRVSPDPKLASEEAVAGEFSPESDMVEKFASQPGVWRKAFGKREDAISHEMPVKPG